MDRTVGQTHSWTAVAVGRARLLTAGSPQPVTQPDPSPFFGAGHVTDRTPELLRSCGVTDRLGCARSAVALYGPRLDVGAGTVDLLRRTGTDLDHLALWQYAAADGPIATAPPGYPVTAPGVGRVDISAVTLPGRLEAPRALCRRGPGTGDRGTRRVRGRRPSRRPAWRTCPPARAMAARTRRRGLSKCSNAVCTDPCGCVGQFSAMPRERPAS